MPGPILRAPLRSLLAALSLLWLLACAEGFGAASGADGNPTQDHAEWLQKNY